MTQKEKYVGVAGQAEPSARDPNALVRMRLCECDCASAIVRMRLCEMKRFL